MYSMLIESEVSAHLNQKAVSCYLNFRGDLYLNKFPVKLIALGIPALRLLKPLP